ncbi:MAG: hypothetical protein ACI4F4_01640 [Lachnospiraceae bacterium]
MNLQQKSNGKIIGIIALVICLLCVGGVLFIFGRFDDQRYPKAYLDAVYHEDYSGMAQVLHVGEDDVKKYFQTAIDNTLQEAISQVSSSGLSDTSTQRMKQTMKALFACAKYEVLDVQKFDSNTYCATINVYQFQFSEEFQKDVQNAVKKNAANLRAKNEAQLMDAAVTIICDCLDEQIANPTYATSPTVVQLTFTKDNFFTLIYDVESQEEINKFTNALMDIEGLK